MDIYWDEHNQFFPVDNRTLVGYSRKSNNGTYNGHLSTLVHNDFFHNFFEFWDNNMFESLQPL